MNKPIFIDAEHFSLLPSDIEPIEGYKEPVNQATGEKFPYCCQFHRNIIEGVQKHYKNFPDCCEGHKEMSKKERFNKNHYAGIAEKIVKQISYTEYHIRNRINNLDWYKDITDYIEYNFWSFGQPTIGIEYYFNYLEYRINEWNEVIPEEKKQRLLEYIKYVTNPKKPRNGSEIPQTDINILLSTYQKWLKIFPWDISYFSNLKDYFKKQLPVLNGKPEVNQYTGMAKSKIITKDGLIDVLLNITNTILTTVNSLSLFDKGLLSEPQSLKLELVLTERKMKLEQGYINNSQNEEHRYRNILKAWFKDEKKFLDEITPLLKSVPLSTEDNPDELPAPEIKPIFKPEMIPAIFDILKGFFSEGHQTQLNTILKTGNDANSSLIFLDNGNRLADAFKQLIKADIITGCQKNELEAWIRTNFQYRYRQTIRSFAPRYLNDIISTNKDNCQNPILNVTLDRGTGKYTISKA